MITLGQNTVAQNQILAVIAECLAHHSAESRKSLAVKIKQLYQRNEIVCLYRVDAREKEIEFGLAFYRDDDEIMREPFMIGGLVYHAHSDEWGIHT
jgi:hypothetical protein